jgi:hypothetical protein
MSFARVRFSQLIRNLILITLISLISWKQSPSKLDDKLISVIEYNKKYNDYLIQFFIIIEQIN